MHSNSEAIEQAILIYVFICFHINALKIIYFTYIINKGNDVI